jgi:oligopeptide transport system ATP-binding protein
MENNKDYILEVNGLKTSFYTHVGEVQAVRGIDFKLKSGDVMGIVGESGSGKSVTARSVMKLIEHPGVIKEGKIIFDGKDITEYSDQKMSNIRGNDMAMIFQDPMTSLNPVFRIENQMTEVIRSYPHEFSGGMRQRVMIAMALSCNPKLLIADEPTTALDVTIQAQILDIMRDISTKLDTAIILITHDLGVIAETCKDLVVMYGGMPMEKGTVDDIFESPQHPYTRGLLKSVPRMDTEEKGRLKPIAGSPPDLLSPPAGCPFSTRCPNVMQICTEEAPPMFSVGENHTSACWLMHEDAPEVEGYRKGAL